MSKLIVYTMATGRYQVYTDLFLHCLAVAYPEYENRVMHLNGDRYPKYYGACARFLLVPEDIEDNDYGYITDIDMLIFREPVSILEFHLNEIKETGLCYSNSPRGTETQGINRLTGLHFATTDWYIKTNDVREKYLKSLEAGEWGHEAIDDELYLMKLTKEVGIPIDKPRLLLARHHGFHLGTIRGYQGATIQGRRRAVNLRLTVDRARQWCELYETNEMRKILSDISKKDKLAHWELTELNKFAQGRAKEKM